YSSHSILYQMTFGILNKIENNNKYGMIMQSLNNLQYLFEENEVLYNEKAVGFANAHKNEEIIYTIVIVVNFGPAYIFAKCSKMKQQSIHSNDIHAGEYFHGPFE